LETIVWLVLIVQEGKKLWIRDNPQDRALTLKKVRSILNDWIQTGGIFPLKVQSTPTCEGV